MDNWVAPPSSPGLSSSIMVSQSVTMDTPEPEPELEAEKFPWPDQTPDQSGTFSEQSVATPPHEVDEIEQDMLRQAKELGRLSSVDLTEDTTNSPRRERRNSFLSTIFKDADESPTAGARDPPPLSPVPSLGYGSPLVVVLPPSSSDYQTPTLRGKPPPLPTVVSSSNWNADADDDASEGKRFDLEYENLLMRMQSRWVRFVSSRQRAHSGHGGARVIVSSQWCTAVARSGAAAHIDQLAPIRLRRVRAGLLRPPHAARTASCRWSSYTQQCAHMRSVTPAPPPAPLCTAAILSNRCHEHARTSSPRRKHVASSVVGATT